MVYIGRRAEQLIKGVTNMVSNRSFLFSIFRVLMMAGTAQVAFVLGGLLGQDVTLEGLTALDGPTGTNAKTLLRAALGLHFWHDKICPFTGSSFI